MTLRKRRIIFAISALLFFVLAPLLLLYTVGYRIDNRFKIGRTGGLYVSSPFSGSEIYIKNRLEKKTNIIQSGIFRQNLISGIYQILVTKEGYWPWLKPLNIQEGLVAEARAVLIPQNPKGDALLRGNFSAIWASPYNKILLLEENKADGVYATFYLPGTNTFLTSAAPETSRLLSFKNEISKIFWEEGAILLKSENRIIRVVFDLNSQTVKTSLEPISDFPVNHKTDKFSRNKKQHLWQDNKANAIWLEWLGEKGSIPQYLCEAKPCEETIYLISNFRFPIKNTDFLPGRRDVIIASVHNAVFALEIDGRGGRLSFPIYKGKEPTFAVFPDEEKVYVLDNGVMSGVNLLE